MENQKQQVDRQTTSSLCLSPQIWGGDVAEIKHQTMSPSLHTASPICFRVCFWKPSTDGLGPSKAKKKDSRLIIVRREGVRRG